MQCQVTHKYLETPIKVTKPTRLHVYYFISLCTVHVRHAHMQVQTRNDYYIVSDINIDILISDYLHLYITQHFCIFTLFPFSVMMPKM